MKKFIIYMVLFVLPVLFATEAAGGVIFVAWDASGGQTGKSWQSAYKNVADAINAAAPGDEIWVKSGIYFEKVVITKEISLYGGFKGTEENLIQRVVAANETILDWKLKYGSVVLMTKGRVDGFTLRGGQGTERQYKDVELKFGGCVLVDYGALSPMIANCKITEAENPFGGCAVACLYAENFIIEDCEIFNNKRPLGMGGGVLLCDKATMTMRRCRIHDNDADGLFCDNNNTVTIEDSEFTNNEWCGAWFNVFNVDIKRCIFKGNSWRGLTFDYGGSGIVADCEILDNSTTKSGEDSYRGGGIAIRGDADLIFYRCNISRNHALNPDFDYAGGSGIYFEHAHSDTLAFICCYIEGNSGMPDYYDVGGGGALIRDSSKVKFINTMILNNQANRGCGLYLAYGANIDLIGCIFSGNSTTKYDYGTYAILVKNDSIAYMYNVTSVSHGRNRPFTAYPAYPYYSEIHAKNCILWDVAPEFDLDGSATVTVEYSDVIGGWPGEGNISEDPLFIDAGETTETQEGWQWREGFYMLQSEALGFPKNSPCIDAGTSDTAMNDAARPPGQGGPRNDMGAFGGPYNDRWKFYMVKPLVNYLLGLPAGYPLDANNDARIDSADIVECIRFIPPIP